MFCDRCGATVPPNQRFCGQCGREFYPATAVVYQTSTGRVQQHVRLLGILWLAASALNALGGVVLLILANTLFVHIAERNANTSFLHPLLTAVAIFILVKAAAGFFAGLGLVRREPWARMLTIVLSFLALFNVPFGTALGIYGLWVLMPAESEREYELSAQGIQAA